MMNHAPRVLPYQVGGELVYRPGTGECPTLENGFPETLQSVIGVDLQEEPPGLDEKSLYPRDLHGGQYILALMTRRGRGIIGPWNTG